MLTCDLGDQVHEARVPLDNHVPFLALKIPAF